MRFIAVVFITMISILPIVATSNPNWSDVQVNENKGPLNQHDQVSCSNSKGMHAIAWVEDRRDTGNGLFIRFFGPDNNPLGPERYVESCNKKSVSIAINDSGYAIVGWADFEHLYTRVLNPDGNFESDKFTIVPSSNFSQKSAVAIDNQKNWICVYIDSSASRLNLACWSNTHQKLSTKTITQVSTYMTNPQVVMNDSGKALILYESDFTVQAFNYSLTSYLNAGEFSLDDRGETQTIKSNRKDYGLTGFLNGQCALVWFSFPDLNSSSAYIVHSDFFQVDQPLNRISRAIDTVLYNGEELGAPSIAIDTSYNSIINWGHYSSNGRVPFTTHTIIANNSTGLVNHLQRIDTSITAYYSSSLAHTAGGFIEYRVDTRFLGRDIVGQKYSITGVLDGDIFHVNRNHGYTYVYEPGILPFSDGKHLVTWIDGRNADPDIFGQFYDASGQPIGTNIQINDDNSRTEQSLLTSAHSKKGTTLTVWRDYRNAKSDMPYQIYGQLFNGAAKKGTNFRIDTNTTSNCYPMFTQVFAMPNGKFIVSWLTSHRLENYYDLVSCVVNEDGISEKWFKFRIADKSGGFYVLNAVIDSLGKSSFFWMDSNEIRFTQLDTNLNTITQPQTFFTLKPDMQFLYPSLVNDPEQGILLTWCEKRIASDNVRYNSVIYARWLSHNAIPVSEEFTIMVDSLSKVSLFNPRMMIMPNGEKVLTWLKHDASSLSLPEPLIKSNYYLLFFTKDMKQTGSQKALPINLQEGSIQVMGNRVWVAWTEANSSILMRNAWSIEELLPVVKQHTIMHQVTEVSNFQFNKNGTNLKLQFNATTLGTGQVNIVQLDGKVICRQPVTILKPGSQFVNIPVNRKNLPAGTYVLQLQIAGRKYISKFLNVSRNASGR